MSPPPSFQSTPEYNDAPHDELQLHNHKMDLVALIVFIFCAFVLFSIFHIAFKWLLRRSRNSIFNLELVQHPGGLSEDAIALLPTFTYTAPKIIPDAGFDTSGMRSFECAVCLSPFRDSEKGRMLPACKHSFHTECIDMWLFSHSTCPLCRALIMPIITSYAVLIPAALPKLEQQERQEEEDCITPVHEIQITVGTLSVHEGNLNTASPATATAVNP
ncbi:hypothetical protein L7F22_048633 [Adiantum nelumboides]|nr:hypothetical protein [Adiantum nelumboides]